MQVTFSGIGGRTALVPQKNGVRTPSWAFNSNLKFTCKMTFDALQDVRVTETPITRPLVWEDDQPVPSNNPAVVATATLTGIPAPALSLKTCNGAPGQFKNGFYFYVTSETHGKCLLIAYLHLGGLLVRPSIKSFKNNAVLVHTEMCGYDTHSVSVDIKIPETSSIHKAGPRYSSTHPPFAIKFILWGQDGLIKNMHESMPLYSYAKDPDQVNCQYFSPNPTPPVVHQPRSERQRGGVQQESPPSSPPQMPNALISASPAPTSPTSSNAPSVSPLASLSSTFVMGSAAAISIPMESFKSLVAYIQKLERQVEMQQQQIDSARQQEELQHRVISQLAQDLKFKSFQCEVLEEKMQQLSTTPHAPPQTGGDSLIAPSQLSMLTPTMAYPSYPSASSASSPSPSSPHSLPTSNFTPSYPTTTPVSPHALPSSNTYSYPTTTTTNPPSSSSIPINLNMPLNPISPTTTLVTPEDGKVGENMQQQLAQLRMPTLTQPNAMTNTINSINTMNPLNTTPTTNAPLENMAENTATLINPETINANMENMNNMNHMNNMNNMNNMNHMNHNGMNNHHSNHETKNEQAFEQDGKADASKSEQREEEVRDFLTQMQKKQKGNFDSTQTEKRQKS